METKKITDGVWQIGKYFIRHAKPTGGKAGKGRNKTSSYQVTVYSDLGYCVLKYYKFKVGNNDSAYDAVRKCREFIKGLIKKDARQTKPNSANNVIREARTPCFRIR